MPSTRYNLRRYQTFHLFQQLPPELRAMVYTQYSWSLHDRKRGEPAPLCLVSRSVHAEAMRIVEFMKPMAFASMNVDIDAEASLDHEVEYDDEARYTWPIRKAILAGFHLPDETCLPGTSGQLIRCAQHVRFLHLSLTPDEDFEYPTTKETTRVERSTHVVNNLICAFTNVETLELSLEVWDTEMRARHKEGGGKALLTMFTTHILGLSSFRKLLLLNDDEGDGTGEVFVKLVLDVLKEVRPNHTITRWKRHDVSEAEKTEVNLLTVEMGKRQASQLWI